MKPSTASGSNQPSIDQHFYSPASLGDAGEDFITDGQASMDSTPVAPDSIKEGWLNCKISNLDGFSLCFWFKKKSTLNFYMLVDKAYGP